MFSFRDADASSPSTMMEFDDDGAAATRKFVDKKKKKRRHRRKQRHSAKASLALLPREILQKIFGYCDRPSLEALKASHTRFSSIIEEEGLLWETSPKLNLDQLPSELLLTIFGYLSRADLGRVAQVSML
jgi:F-box-like